MKIIVLSTEDGDKFVCKCKNFRHFEKVKKSLSGFNPIIGRKLFLESVESYQGKKEYEPEYNSFGQELAPNWRKQMQREFC